MKRKIINFPQIQIDELTIDAPILPNFSLGGLYLRIMLDSLADIVNGIHNKYQTSDWYEFHPPYELRYNLKDLAISFAVDVRTGHVFEIFANEGYQGALFGSIKLGMTIKEAQKMIPDLYFDETYEVFSIRRVKGVTIEVISQDPESNDDINLPIASISVYADELMWRGNTIIE